MYLSYSSLLDDSHRVIFLSETESNINFLIDAEEQKYFFRLNKNSKLGLRNQIKYEYEALKTLGKTHVTPKVFFLDDSSTFFEYGALIMQYIEGRPLDYKGDMNEAAKIFARIHSLDIDNVNTSHFLKSENIVEESLDRSKSYLKNLISSEIDIKLKLKLSELLEFCEKNKSCGDYFGKDRWNTINNTAPNAKNFIISETKRKGYLIDWEKPIISDPAVDIAYFLSPIVTSIHGDYIFSKDEEDNFFKRYIMNLDKYDRDIVERVNTYRPYMTLELLSKVVNGFVMNGDKRFYSAISEELLDVITKDIL